jgi:cbb3-type cytochrome oxidase maturation protein
VGKSIFEVKIKRGMSVIIILMIASISVAGLFLGLFIWSIKKGQYDDEVSPPVRILFEDKPVSNPSK